MTQAAIGMASVQMVGTQLDGGGAVCLGRPLGAPQLFSQAGSGCVGLLWGEVLLPQGQGSGRESLASMAKAARPFSGHPGGHPGALRAVIPAWLGVGAP